jgi:integrase
VVDKLLVAADEVLAGRLATLACTGMRVGELRNLQRQDVDLKENWIFIRNRSGAQTKTGMDRRVPIHPALRPYLDKAFKASAGRGYLFCAAPTPKYPKGDHFINERHLNTQLTRLAERVGVPAGRVNDGIVIHSFRHFFKTFCLNQGIPLMAVDQWQGHVGDRSASAMYYELSDDESQRLMSKVPFSKSARETAGR